MRPFCNPRFGKYLFLYDCNNVSMFMAVKRPEIKIMKIKCFIYSRPFDCFATAVIAEQLHVLQLVSVNECNSVRIFYALNSSFCS